MGSSLSNVGGSLKWFILGGALVSDKGQRYCQQTQQQPK